MSNLHAYAIPRVGIFLGTVGRVDLVDPEDWEASDYYAHYADREAIRSGMERVWEEDS